MESPLDEGLGELRVRVLGELVVDGVDVRALRSRKARTMLRVLAIDASVPVSVDRLIDCLWGDSPPTQPEREVAVAASRLRGLIGADRIVRGDAGYVLHADWIDAVALVDLAVESRRRLEVGDNTGARATAEAALRLIRGTPLADESDASWVAGARARLERTIVELRLTAAQAALSAGGHADALSNATAVLAADPYDEAALRIAMHGHVAAGRPGSALALYAAMRERLAEELGASPAADTEALHTAIVCEDPLPSSTVGVASIDRPALPGRSSFFDLLDAELVEAAGGSRIVTLGGEPGVGKSRLATEWVQARRSMGTPVLIGRCDEIAASLPFQPVVEAIVGYLREVGEADAVHLLGADRSMLAPWLGLGSASSTAVPGVRVTRDAAQTLLFSALVRVFERLATMSRQTVVLFIDDLHLADSSTVAWLSFIEHGGSAPLLVVTTRRSGEGGLLPGRPHMVPPLDLDAAREIVGESRAVELFDRSRGNALLLVELATSDDHEGAVTHTIRESVDTRCARLGDTAATLRAAAVLGRVVDLDLLAEVLGLAPMRVLADLETGLERSFLEDEGGRFAFRHELVREALVAGTTSARRAWLHRAALRVLDQRVDTDAALIAHHARLAGDAERASRALVEAGALAARRHDLPVAESLLDEAIALVPFPDAFLARGRVRLSRSDLDGAETDALAALDHGAGAAAWELRAWVARYRHDMQSAIEFGTVGMRTADDDVTRASCLLVVAFAHRGIGDLPRADEALVQATATDADGRIGIPSWTGVLRLHQGRVDEALELLEPAVGAPPDVLHGFWREHVLQMTVHGLALRGRVGEAFRMLDRLRVEMEQRGSILRYHGVDDVYRGWLLNHLGSEASAECSEAARQSSGIAEIVAQATLDLAAVCLRDGRTDDAESWLADAAGRLAEGWFHNRWRCEQRIALLSARLSLDAGDHAQAQELAGALEDEARGRGERRYETLARVIGARARVRTGMPIDPDLVAADFKQLDEVAALESWWMIAELAADAGIDGWWRLAEERVERLATRSGEHGDTLRRFAAARLSALGR